MSKLLKRTFALALVFCMLLSVLPAVSAAAPTSFSLKLAKGKSQDTANTDYNGRNAYVLGGRVNYTTTANGLTLSATANTHWVALMLKVPADGNYNIVASYTSNQTDGAQEVQFVILDPYATLSDGTTYKDAIKAKDGSGTTKFFDTYTANKSATMLNTTFNPLYSHTSASVEGNKVYLGNHYLKADTEYLIGMQPTVKNPTNSSWRAYTRLTGLTFTPCDDGASFVEQVSAATYQDGNVITSQVNQIYQLAADLYAPNAILTLGAQDLALNGHKLTVGTVTTPFIPGAATQLAEGVISGITGDGSVVTGGGAPILPNGGQKTISLETAENTYEFFTPTLVSGQYFSGQSFMKDPTNTGFAFQLDLPDAAKAAIAKGNSGLKVSMDWSIGDTKGATVVFSDADLVKWAKGEGDTFYIEVADIGSLLQEHGQINCTPTVGKDFLSFTGTDITYDGAKQAWDEDGELKILCIGNSFSIDTLEYAWQIANNLGVEKVKLGNLYIAGCSIDTHLDNFQNDKAAYTYYTTTNGAWKNTKNTSGNTALADENWDFISFQQNSGNSDDASTYGNLDALMDIVEKKCPTSRFIWNMTWAYQESYSSVAQADMYSGILNAVQTVITANERIENIMPVGTAIQNARTSFLGDNLNRDGAHLSQPLGQYIAGITFIGNLLDLDVTKLTWKPSDVAADEARVAIESAKNAIVAPYAVTQSKETKQDTIVAEGTVLDLKIEGETTWSATSGMRKYNFIEGDSRYSKYAGTMASTRSFTKAELPVGTVIEIAEGFKYRPEGWVGTTSGSCRSNEVTTSKIVIDELWWGSYTNRGFNIAKIDGSTYASDPEGFQNALKITVPSN